MTISVFAGCAEHAVDTAQRAHDQLFPIRESLLGLPEQTPAIRDAVALIGQTRSALRTAGAR